MLTFYYGEVFNQTTGLKFQKLSKINTACVRNLFHNRMAPGRISHEYMGICLHFEISIISIFQEKTKF